MDFLKSRIRRFIAPLCVWGGTAACVGILTDRFTWEQGMAYFLTTAAFMQNIYNVYNPNNFGYAWFVACEFQFTVLFMLLMLYKNTARIIYGLVAALVLLTFYHPHFRTYLLFEFQGLIIGTLLALILKKFPYIAAEANKIPMAVRRFIVMWCIALGLAMSKVLPMDISFSVSSVFFSIGFSILLAAPYNMYGQLGRWIKQTGDISYSVYLCHIPVILLCN